MAETPGAAESPLAAAIDRLAAQVEPEVIAWRRDVHQHPELSNREFRTAQLVADQLKSFGLEVQTGVAHTGVVGILRGTQDRPVVALRADMDALPVTEALDLPFASKEKALYNGKETGVMHACGHDAHTAILLGAAKIMSQLRDQIPGTVKFIFQPAEEGAPEGEEGGAALMIKQGVLENPKPDAIFGLHTRVYPTGTISYRPGPAMASSDTLSITIHGRQTHGARPWDGVDPIVAAAQVIMGLQTVVSRQTDLTESPAVVTIGIIRGGVRSNIIPDEVEMTGTIRTLDEKMRDVIHMQVKRTVIHIAESAGATADVRINKGYPVTVNDPELTARMVPVFEKIAGKEKVSIAPAATGAEDFSYYGQQIPGLYFFLGVTPPDQDWTKAPVNHSPLFFVDENALITGVRALAQVAVEYMR
ncbi:MAG: amidohydrolase [bacterium]